MVIEQFFRLFFSFLMETFKEVVFVKGITLIKVGNRSCRNEERTDHYSRKDSAKNSKLRKVQDLRSVETTEGILFKPKKSIWDMWAHIQSLQPQKK